MTLYRLVTLLLFYFCLTSMQTQAQDAPLKPSNDPLEVTADGSLEWDRAKQFFTARDNAKAVQGASSIEAQTLTALYRDGADNGLEIYEIKADTNVVLNNQESIAYGDQGFYDLDKGYAELTGENLKLVSPDQTITAKEKFEYWVEEGRAQAIGRPRVIRPKADRSGNDILDADLIIANFKTNAQGERVIDTLEAKGNVVITTPAEIMTGAYGIYRSATNKAELSGGVTITRGPNILEGARAVVDLNTNISQIFGGAKQITHDGKGRVRGVFYPSSEKKKEEKAAPTKTPVQAPPVEINLPPGIEDDKRTAEEFAPLTRP